MNRSWTKLAAIAVVLFLMGWGGVALAEETTLTGELTAGPAEGTYLLIEQESGDSIQVMGSAALADHVGTLVKLTGEWSEDDQGEKYFKVSSVEPITEPGSR